MYYVTNRGKTRVLAPTADGLGYRWSESSSWRVAAKLPLQEAVRLAEHYGGVVNPLPKR